jgi:phage terminase large subunit-like protein
MDAVTRYARDVVDGRYVVGKLVRQACERHLRDLVEGPARGLYFDVDAAERALTFYGFLKHSKGEWAGRKLVLRPWQEFIEGSVFGWQRQYGQCTSCENWSVVNPATALIICDNPECEPTPAAPGDLDWLRRFRTAYEELARKNGKSTRASGRGLYLAFFDGEGGAEVYAAATKRDQAKIVWSEASRMVKASPSLKARITSLTNNLHILGTASKFEPLGADNDSTDGLNIHGAIVDELHAHKTRSMVDVLETATGSRRQPLISYITTAGFDRHSVCWEKHDYGVKILEGIIEDDSYFAFIASIDEGDDWRDPAVWPKANPNLGVSVKMDDLQMKAERAKQVPGQQNAFKRLHLDVWTEQAERWLDVAVWDENAGPDDCQTLREKLQGRECYGGLDLSSNTDLTSLSLYFPDPELEGDDEAVAVLSFSWIPEENMRQRAERDRVPYPEWVEQGFIASTPGNSIDHDFIRTELNELAGEFVIKEIGFDPWNARQIATQLAGDGFEMVEIRQGFYTMSEPSKLLETLVLRRRLRHGGQPVLRWAASNVAVATDASGNIKPDKKKSTERIDPVVSLVTALARVVAHTDDSTEPQIFLGGEEEEDA